MDSTGWTVERQAAVIQVLNDEWTGEKDRKYYHTKKKFELVILGGLQRVRRKNGKIMATNESHASIVKEIHVGIHHKGGTKTHKAVQEMYENITLATMKTVISNCVRCAEKAKKKCSRSVVVRPITVEQLNDRGQMDLIDYRTLPDGEYWWILHYKKVLTTKYSFLRPLETKEAVLVTKELRSIFLTYGAPRVLQADNGGELVAKVIQELATLWPSLILVHGRPRHPQSQGCVERANCVVKDALVAWMRDKNTAKWATALPFVQWSMNTTYHETIKMTPYEAVFGQKPRVGLGANVPRDFLGKLRPGILEEELEAMLADVNGMTSTEVTTQVSGDVNTNM